MQPAFPKPKHKRNPLKEAFKTLEDGREICYTEGVVGQSKKGRNEYRRRIALMVERQNGVCCLFGICPDCPRTLEGSIITFEHENGRGAGKRDDRIEINGKWINGAAHLLCNGWKGSRRIPYNVKLQAEASA
jgi:hypothetical protein